MLDINQPPRRSEDEIIKLIEEIYAHGGSADQSTTIRRSLMMFLPVEKLQEKGWAPDKNVSALKLLKDIGEQDGFNTPGRLAYHYLPVVWEHANKEVSLMVDNDMKSVMSWLWLMGFGEEFLNEEMGEKNGEYFGKKHLVIVSTLVGLNWRNLDNGVWTVKNENGRTELTEVMREAQVEDAGRIASEAAAKLLSIDPPTVPIYERDPDAPPSASRLPDEEIQRLTIEHVGKKVAAKLVKVLGDGDASNGVQVVAPEGPQAFEKPEHLPTNKMYTDRIVIEAIGDLLRKHGNGCKGCMNFMLYRMALHALANIAVNGGSAEYAEEAIRGIRTEFANGLQEMIDERHGHNEGGSAAARETFH